MQATRTQFYTSVFQEVSAQRFSRRVASLKRHSARHGANLWKYSVAEYKKMRCFLSSDGKTGFALKSIGGMSGYDLVNVFNVGLKGMGNILVPAAIEYGAVTLDCLDGFLPQFYAKFGFVEFTREPNWTEGEPDVVFMTYVEHIDNDLRLIDAA